MSYGVSNISYNSTYKVIGKHPVDGRLFAVRHGNVNGLYVVDRDLNLIATLNTTLLNYDVNGLGNGINECVILSTGTMLCWGMYRTGNNETVIWRSKDTTYSEFEAVLTLPNDITFIEKSVGVSTKDDTIMCCEYTTKPIDPETGLWTDPQQLKIWRGTNDGQTWSVVVTRNRNPQFEGDTDIIRHFHTVRYDPYEDLFWIGSGDGGYQCASYTINPDGTNFQIILQGERDEADGQMYRTTAFMFTEDYIWWGSDAQRVGYHPFGRINRLTREYEALIEPNDCIRIADKINHPSGDFLIAQKSYEKAPTNPEGITELFVCDNFVSGEWYPIYSWDVASLDTVSVFYQIVDNKDGRIFVYCRRILDNTSTAQHYITAIMDIAVIDEPVGTLTVKTGKGLLDIPVYDPSKVPVWSDCRLKLMLEGEICCLKLNEVVSTNVPVIKIKTTDEVKMIAGTLRKS